MGDDRAPARIGRFCYATRGPGGARVATTEAGTESQGGESAGDLFAGMSEARRKQVYVRCHRNSRRGHDGHLPHARGLFGSIGLIAVHSESVGSYRMIRSSQFGNLNHRSLANLNAPPAVAIPANVALGPSGHHRRQVRLNRSKMTLSHDVRMLRPRLLSPDRVSKRRGIASSGVTTNATMQLTVGQTSNVRRTEGKSSAEQSRLVRRSGGH